jgi:hypothetical protein
VHGLVRTLPVLIASDFPGLRQGFGLVVSWQHSMWYSISPVQEDMNVDVIDKIH